MVLIGAKWTANQLLYDVTNPVRPRLLCKIANTSAHLFTGDTFEYLKPVSANETDVMLHSLGSGNESHAGTFPFYVTSASWLPDQSVMAYTLPRSADEGYPNGGVDVYLYAQRKTGLLFTYRTGIGDCICRFGLPPEVLAVSPDGQYVAAGHLTGKGSQPIAVYRVSDRALVTTLDPGVMWAFWDRSGHRLFLDRFGSDTAQSWTPEAGVSALNGAGAWSYLPGLSPDGNQIAYTAYVNPSEQSQPRIYVYDLKAATTHLVVEQLRTQILFVKDGWVWYLEERACTASDGCPGATMPTGRVYAMNLSAGTEQEVSWAFGDDPHGQGGDAGWGVFGPGEFWPAG
ncbi:MAG: hypothetical protein AUI42_03545 [Actinobacteria bacterium 13_1_40CM_2_65_8]|nr:MAG: hypothetical protein AUI42_03545 [Actinobacteria bacterium 13_1_40CM_2_65_8]